MLLGVLVVGLGGANGVTLLAGHIANTRKLSWEGPSPWGRMSANLLGCITQLPAKGGKGGYRERYALADFCDAAIGGWDIRPTPLGEALYNARILDFDLVRQVQVHDHVVTSRQSSSDCSHTADIAIMMTARHAHCTSCSIHNCA
jgi:Myo-inositol-1-phosphate synthase